MHAMHRRAPTVAIGLIFCFKRKPHVYIQRKTR